MTPDVRAPHADLSRNVIAFASELRSAHGFLVGPGEVEVALRALEIVDVSDPARVRDALRPVLCASRGQAGQFDRLFDLFFLPQAPAFGPPHPAPSAEKSAAERPPGPAEGARDRSEHGEPQDKQEHEEHEDAAPEGPRHAPRDHGKPDGPDEPAGRGPLVLARFSALDMKGDPPGVDEAGLPEMRAVVSDLVSKLTLGRSRTWRPGQRGRRLDFRRTLRHALASGGDVVSPRWLHHPRRNPRFVLLLDGSRSMTPHTALMLQFAYALTGRARHTEVFFFSTDLSRATPELRRMVRQHRTGALPGFGSAWGGGTRIGASLARLTREHPNVLSGETLVFVLSDGLDVGEPEVLERAVRDIARRTAGVVWLNPLLGTPGYEPTARGMKAALPHLSVFASANDLASLREVADRVRMR